MYKILLHTVHPTRKNGPNTVNDCIANSEYLQSRYEIQRLNQNSSMGKNPLRLLRLVLNMSKEIHDRKPDIVLVTGLQSAGFCCTIAAKLARVDNIIVCIHGYAGDDMSINRLSRFFYNCIAEPLTLHWATCVYSVCHYGGSRQMVTKHAALNYYGTIHNCLPPQTYIPQSGFRESEHIGKEDVVIVSVGRVTFDKGHRDIIRMVNEGFPKNVKVIIVGDGAYLAEYKEKCSEAIENRQLILLGKRSDVLDILKESDIFLFPSYHENLSMALLEACYSKCAVVALDVDGNPEIIENKVNGILVPKNDYEGLKNAVVELIENVDLRNQYAENACITTAEEYSYSVFEQRMGKLFQEVLNGENRSRKKK